MNRINFFKMLWSVFGIQLLKVNTYYYEKLINEMHIVVSVCLCLGLSTLWFVYVSGCQRFGMAMFWFFVGVSVCRRFDCPLFGLSTFRLITQWLIICILYTSIHLGCIAQGWKVGMAGDQVNSLPTGSCCPLQTCLRRRYPLVVGEYMQWPDN